MSSSTNYAFCQPSDVSVILWKLLVLHLVRRKLRFLRKFSRARLCNLRLARMISSSREIGLKQSDSLIALAGTNHWFARLPKARSVHWED